VLFLYLALQYAYFFFNGATAPSGSGPPQDRGFTITLRHTTLGRTPLDEWSARRRDLYLTTHHTQNRQTPMPPAGLKPSIPANERLQTQALDRAATGISSICVLSYNKNVNWIIIISFFSLFLLFPSICIHLCIYVFVLVYNWPCVVTPASERTRSEDLRCLYGCACWYICVVFLCCIATHIRWYVT
jgi:hypothetical protein